MNERAMEMGRLPRKIYTYEFKLEAVRLVESGQTVAEAARSLGVVEQALSNWIRAHKAGKLTANGRGSKLSAEQIEIRQLRAELARVKMERDILGKAAAYFSRGQR
jgi:transposase